MAMAAKVDPEKRRMVGALLSRSFTLGQPDLTAVESIALECLKQIASEGRVADQYEICAGVGSGNSNGGTVAGIIRRLVAKGYVEHVLGHPLQRSIWVRIVGTDLCTAEPQCKTTHWRYREEQVPAPAIQTVRERLKPIASMIEAEGRLLGKHYTDWLADLVYIGWNTYCAEKAGE